MVSTTHKRCRPTGVPGPAEPARRESLAEAPTVHELLARRRCVLMVGGAGRRLRPLTHDCPKPLLRIGGKPVLVRILEQLKEQGVTRFSLCVHYKSEAFKELLGDGRRYGVEIEYIEESEPLGTAGPLRALPAPDQAFFVMNGDVLSNVDLGQLLGQHNQAQNAATMCLAPHLLEVPYGVVALEGDQVQSIDEQPAHQVLVNAGIYVLEPSVLELLPEDKPYDMPTLLMDIVRQGGRVGGRRLEGYWQDIGNNTEFQLAQERFSKGKNFPNENADSAAS